MTKLRRDLTVAMAGACSGLFSVSVYLLAARIQTFYDFLKWREENGYPDYSGPRDDLSWVPVVVWHIVLSIAASLLIHRYATSRTSTFLRWQAIGVGALFGWCLTAFVGIGIACLIHGNIYPIEQVVSISMFIPVAQFVAAVFASNVLFGTAIQAASTENLLER